MPDSTSGAVLVSWVARDNDPYGSRKKGASGSGFGPTLTLLSDNESEWKGRIGAVELFWNRTAPSDEAPQKHLEEVVAAVEKHTGLRAETTCFTTDDPTDLSKIHSFLKKTLPVVRDRHPGKELVINISPGTASMQTMWVLHGECGFVEKPFRLVRTYRPEERRDGGAVRDVRLGIDTFFSAQALSAKPLVAPSERIRIRPNRVRSAALQRVYAEAARVARIKVPVLIVGERGTGKTTLASWIRYSSPFRKPALDADWASVVCGQFIGDTMRSELFGSKKGSYTGASADKPGLLAKADGDTLFLDEIGDVPRDVQRLLIRALEEHVYLPLGATKAERSDFRLVSATNLPKEVLDRQVDADFLDRISYAQLRLPSLREMPEDLDWLWADVYAEAHQRSAVKELRSDLPPDWNRKILAALRKHPLPGNIRDLYRVAYRLIAARADAAMANDLDACVAEALGALGDDTSLTTVPGLTQAQRIYGAFARGEKLEAVIGGAELVRTEDMRSEFEAWLANGLTDLARTRRRPLKELTDVTDRTLRNWKKA
jgi:DNA-binding NtrC family response regulator